MFSSSSSPFSQVSPFLNWNPSPASSSLNNINIHESLSSLSHQEDLLSLYLSNVSPTTLIDTSSNNKNKNKNKNPDIISRSRTKKTKKTDRHSKIFTAQGPRDRRVRLSIDISKKFFGLQDLLGFDKASLTLGWLLNKSKAAISELLRANNIEDTCLCSFLSEDGQEGSEAADDDNSVVGFKETATASKRKGRNRKPQMMSAMDQVAKESRMKARQRARERTRAKNLLRNIIGAASEQQQSLLSPTSINYQWGQIGGSKSADSSRQSTLTSSNEHSPADPVEGFFFVNPRTGEVNNINHHQEDAFSESANFKTRTNKLDFNLWRSSMNHDDLF